MYIVAKFSQFTNYHLSKYQGIYLRKINHLNISNLSLDCWKKRKKQNLSFFFKISVFCFIFNSFFSNETRFHWSQFRTKQCLTPTKIFTFMQRHPFSPLFNNTYFCCYSEGWEIVDRSTLYTNFKVNLFKLVCLCVCLWRCQLKNLLSFSSKPFYLISFHFWTYSYLRYQVVGDSEDFDNIHKNLISFVLFSKWTYTTFLLWNGLAYSYAL